MAGLTVVIMSHYAGVSHHHVTHPNLTHATRQFHLNKAGGEISKSWVSRSGGAWQRAGSLQNHRMIPE